MTDALVSLPPHLRRRLEGALDTGLISTSSTPATVRSVLGLRDGAEYLLKDLKALERTGVTGRAAAAWLRAVEQARARSPTPDLVWSGPDVPGLHARDTRRVYEELLGSAERTVWASTYAYFDGPRAFATLAGRMEAIPELQVTLLLFREDEATPPPRISSCVGSPIDSGRRTGPAKRGPASTTTRDRSIPTALRGCSTPRR